MTCDNYVWTQILGVGSSSCVCQASQVDDSSEYALKIINLKDNPTFNLSCFKTETEVLSQLSHPNIIKMFEFKENVNCKVDGIDLKVNYISVELLPNCDLFSYLEKTWKFSEETSRYLFQQIIEGLDYLHSQNYAHRDIKPENLIFDSQFNLKLVDFGFATTKESASCQVGTFGYMLPEIFNNQKYDVKSADLFGAAVVLFNMVTQHPPFKSASLDDKLYQLIATGQLSKFWRIHSKAMGSKDFFSKEFKKLINWMLSYDPSRRLSIEEVKQSKWYTQSVPSHAEFLSEMTLRRNLITEFNSRSSSETPTSS